MRISRGLRGKLANVTLAAVSLGLGLFIGELGLRLWDHYALTSLRLVSTQPASVPYSPDLSQRGLDHMKDVPLARGVNSQWFETEPPAPPNRRAPSPDMVERYRNHPDYPLESLYLWNRRHVMTEVCQGKPFLGGIEDVFVFDSPSGSRFPRYRFPPGATLPSGLVTNEFGWRGPALSLNRPPGAIRIAFVGASTTVNPHGYPFSYPEYIVHWLNLWARQHHPGLTVEIVNAGREGTNSNDFQAIVRDELIVTDPDLVVYYEGSNQFWPVTLVEWAGGTVAQRQPVSLVEGFLKTHSAIGRRLAYGLSNGQDGREPRKLFGTVRWPASIDEFDPDPMDPDLPINLPTIIQDIGAIDTIVRENGSDLAVSSFVWLAYDGMMLELPRQKVLHDYLNETFGPFPYAHIRRMADFQNRVFAKFAGTRGALFLDVAKSFPQDSNLFDDAIHMNPTGIRLHAWIALQELIPILEDRITSGRLPRPVRPKPAVTHSAQASKPVLVRIEDLKKSCGTE